MWLKYMYRPFLQGISTICKWQCIRSALHGPKLTMISKVMSMWRCVNLPIKHFVVYIWNVLIASNNPFTSTYVEFSRKLYIWKEKVKISQDKSLPYIRYRDTACLHLPPNTMSQIFNNITNINIPWPILRPHKILA